jgi:hypothetical protein
MKIRKLKADCGSLEAKYFFGYLRCHETLMLFSEFSETPNFLLLPRKREFRRQ